MDQSDELEKLSQLMANGTISKKEFNKKKQEILFPNKKKRRGLWWKAPLIVVAVIVVLALLNNDNKSRTNNTASSTSTGNTSASTQQAAENTSGQADTPGCASDFAKENIGNTYADQPDTSVRLKFLDWKDVRQVSYDPKTKERKCQGYFIFNSGNQEGRYDYRFYYATPTSASWLIAIDPIDDGASETSSK